uniref:uncharacterized protein LOC120329085 n=1 Tax=Styela clava TaxID=7725 RepID=UPI0019393141|nr:uncharacterized protein LOC120329085 [Styela clava]
MTTEDNIENIEIEASNVSIRQETESTEEAVIEGASSPSTLSKDEAGANSRKARTRALQREKARALASQSKYYEAISTLEEVSVEDEETTLGIKLLMAVCYLQLGRENKASKAIKEIKKIILSDPFPDVDDIMALIDDLIGNSSFTSALIMLPIASEIYLMGKEPDEILDGLFRCINKANDCARPMINAGDRSRVLAIDFGIDYMVELLGEIKQQTKADPEKRVMKQALAITLISYNYWMIKDNSKGVRFREQAVAAMEKQFGKHASQRRIYGNMLYNLGVGYDILNKRSKSKETYEKAIVAIEDAQDFDDEDTRRKEIQMCREKLKELAK